jgi:thiosulfate reductase cytochrome b subunit
MADISRRHSLVVRITHWTNTIAFLALLVSGTAILLAHPRLYWGETGAFGGPALFDLPLPLNMDQSGWGRSLHFLAAWICVFNGAVYVAVGAVSRHFDDQQRTNYSGFQRVAYLVVVFLLCPLMIITGLAMSPAMTAVFPVLGPLFGGRQSSRTIHFFVTNLLVLFTVGHVAMVYLSGFRNRMRGMIFGREIPVQGDAS